MVLMGSRSDTCDFKETRLGVWMSVDKSVRNGSVAGYTRYADALRRHEPNRICRAYVDDFEPFHLRPDVSTDIDTLLTGAWLAESGESLEDGTF